MPEKITTFLYGIMRNLLQFYYFRKCEFKIYNKEKLPLKHSGGYIIACNHQSYADPPIIASVVKGRFSFMAKKELFEKGFFFVTLIKVCGAFPVDRGANDNSAIERSVSDLKKGRIFVIFPEGTRSKGGTIGRAKSGVALIAAGANVPVLPVCIMYGLGGNDKNVDFAIGDMIPAEEINIDLESGNRKELKRVSERIINSIKELQTQIFTERGTDVE